jgi:hypothetical protein
MRNWLIFILICLCFSSCKRNTTAIVNKEEYKEITEIEIVYDNMNYENKLIEHFYISDNLVICNRKIEDFEYFTKHKHFQAKMYEITYKKSEVDTLKKLIYKIFESPKPGKEVSCYAGDYITFSYKKFGNFKMSLAYSSVGNWTKISPEISKLYAMTFHRVYKKDRIKPMKY